jgi:hypothetical protein
MRKLSLGLAALAIVAVTAYVALAQPTSSPSTMMASPNSMSNSKPCMNGSMAIVGCSQFNPMNASGQQGTVIMTAQGDKTKVVINLTGALEGAIEPAHVHKGNCQHPGDVIYPLTDVVAGHSTTIVNAPIAQVSMTGDSVNVHKSKAQLNLYVACADLLSPK